jgi:hypothetical protein
MRAYPLKFAMAKVVPLVPELRIEPGGLLETVKVVVESFQNGDFDKVNNIIEELPPNSQQLVKKALKNQYFNTENLDKDR